MSNYTQTATQAFLGTQDDAITDEEAASKYNEYKLEFRRQQLNEFFVSHRWVLAKVQTIGEEMKEGVSEDR